MEIKIEKLSKKFNNTLAVDNISFIIKKNKTIGLLGPNGCGKTTSIGMMLGLIKPTSGKVFFDNQDINKIDKTKILNEINFASPYIELPKKLTVRQNLDIYARLYGVKNINERISEISSDLNLHNLLDKMTGQLSSGQKNRVSLAKSLINNPKVLFLDEPTTGLDPGSRRVLWDEIKRLRDNGVTVILTTQYLEEADELADRIAIIDEGLVVAEGTSDELKASIGGDVITFAFNDNDDLENAKNILTNSVQEKNELRITVEDGASRIPGYLKDLSNQGVEVSSVSANKPTLDDVFLEVTGYRLEGSESSQQAKQKSNR